MLTDADVRRSVQTATENAHRELQLNARQGRRLSPRDDVERAVRHDPTARALPSSLRSVVANALLDYEFTQLHGDGFRRAGRVG
jgi:hypothetical protein